MTGPMCFLRMSQIFALTLRIDVLECERFAPVCVAEHHRYGKGSAMVWVRISMQGKTDLHIIENDTLTAVRYVNKILDVYVRPYAGAIGADFILMDDNARPHRAHVTRPISGR